MNLVSKCFKTFNKSYFDFFFWLKFLKHQTFSNHSNHSKNAQIVRKKILRWQNFSSKFLDFDILNLAFKCFKTFNQSSFKYFLDAISWNRKHSLIIKVSLKILKIVQKKYSKKEIFSSKFLNFKIWITASKCSKTFNWCYFASIIR